MTVKKQIAIKPNDAVNASHISAAVTAPVTVVKTASGAVTTMDKLKGYYKSLISLVGALLVILNQLTPLGDFLPAKERGYLSAAIAVLAALSTFLVSNQHWVDDL